MKFIGCLLRAGLLGLGISAKAELVTLFSDNMESGTNGWTIFGASDGSTLDGGLWHQSSRRSVSGSNSWYYGFENLGTYDIGGTVGTLTSPEINLTGVTNASITWKHWLQQENDLPWDDDWFYMYVEDESNGMTCLHTSTMGGMADWETLTVDLTAHVGKKIRIKIECQSFEGCSDCEEPQVPEGWYIDDVVVTGNR